jgi:hypothetical protein
MCAFPLDDDEVRGYIDKYVTHHDLITDEERHAKAVNFEIFISAVEKEISDMR